MYYKLLLATLFHALFGTASFSNNSILNPIEHLVKEFCNQTLVQYGYEASLSHISFLWSFLNAAGPFGGLLSGFIVAHCTDRFGRKGTTMVINNIMLISASLLMWIGKEVSSYEFMIIGRMIAGMTSQVSIFNFIYIIECSDALNAGLTAMIVRFGFIIYYILGAMFGLPTIMGKPNTWQYTFLIPIIPSVIHLLGAIWIPESPKHLYITKGQHSKAVSAIKFYRGPETDIDQVTKGYEAEMTANVGHERITIREVLRIKHLRMPFWICVIADCSSRMGGFNIENFYSTDIMRSLGVSPETAAIFNVVILRLPSIIFALISMVLVRKLNARPYLLGTLVGGNISISLLFLTFVYNHFKPGSTLGASLGVISLFLGITSWHMGLGYLPQFLPGMCCPQISRSLTTAYQWAFKCILAITITAAYPPLATMVGPPIALLPMIICGYIGLMWLWKYLPETKDKDVNEVVKIWMDNSDDNHTQEQLSSPDVKSYGTRK